MNRHPSMKYELTEADLRSLEKDIEWFDDKYKIVIQRLINEYRWATLELDQLNLEVDELERKQR